MSKTTEEVAASMAAFNQAAQAAGDAAKAKFAALAAAILSVRR